ncbi:MAG: MFS transporter [Candidatus Cloacimonetes bacterium]|nr:MFS transporter [Candidatus Cloacimonadota bacterium]
MSQKTRYSLAFFILYLSFGLLIPYFPVLFQNLGYTPSEIAILSSLQPFFLMIFSPISGYLLSKYQKSPKKIVILTAGLTLASCFFLFFKLTFTMAMIAFGLHFSFRVIINPLLDCLAVAFTSSRNLEYGKIRIFGSLGFLLASYLGGYLFIGDNSYYFLVIYTVLIALCIPVFSSLKEEGLFEVEGGMKTASLSSRQIIFLGAAFFMNISHCAYFVYYSIFLKDQMGISFENIGFFWVFAVLCEIILMQFYSKWFSKFSSNTIILFSLLVASFRWSMVAFVPVVWGQFLLQACHGFTFATFHLASMNKVKELFSLEAQSYGFTLYNAASFGLSGVIGNLLIAYLYNFIGIKGLFLFSALMPLLGIFLYLKETYDSKKAILSNNS